MKILLILFLLIGCGQEEPINRRASGATVDNRLRDIWNKTTVFFQDNGVCCGPRGKIKTEVSPVDSFENNVIGKCLTTLNTNTILILKPEQMGPLTLEAVMLHERGHCQSLFNHVNDIYDIMNPQIPNEKFLEVHLEEMKAKMIRQMKSMLK